MAVLLFIDIEVLVLVTLPIVLKVLDSGLSVVLFYLTKFFTKETPLEELFTKSLFLS